MDPYAGDLIMDECPPDLRSPEEEPKFSPSTCGSTAPTRGIASSFGFKKRINSASATGSLISANPNAARRLANTNSPDNDLNGNNDNADVDVDYNAPLTSNAVPSGRTTPRIPPPKKEANATKQVSRFGFRQPPGNRFNKVADINGAAKPTYMDNDIDGNYDNRKINGVLDSNRNRGPGDNGKFMLQTTQLPKPVPVRIMDAKTAKTLANNNRKISGMNPSSDESSKDGSSYLTEDSGIGSTRYEKLNSSPKFGSNNRPRRNLDTIVTGNKFDVRDYDLSNTNCMTSVPMMRPSSHGCSFSLVRDRTMEYQRNIDRDQRKISVTSSEVSTSDCADEEYVAPKTRFLKSTGSGTKTFLKPKGLAFDSSPPTSDDQMWTNGGEAMAVPGTADDFNCSFSSSDESKEHLDAFNKKDKDRNKARKSTTVGSVLDNLVTASKTHSLHKLDVKQVLLTIEDPKFAAVVAARQYSSLISEEPSPDDTLFNTFSLSEKEDTISKTITLQESNLTFTLEKPSPTEEKYSSSTEKQLLDLTNDKQTNSSPGTPTNASNSFSLSEGRDFLIDDEIADQPALLFDDTITNNTTSETATTSMASEMTLVDATPKTRRKVVAEAWNESPLVSRRKQSGRLRSRADSLDTLSPCESIASDDFMMDYEHSMSSGIDDIHDTRSERNSTAFLNDEGAFRSLEISKNDLLREWSCLLSAGSVKSLTTRPSTRLLNRHHGHPSRGSTPPTTAPDSPRSIDCTTPSLRTRPARPSANQTALSSTSSSAHNSNHNSLLRLASQQSVLGSGGRSSSSMGGYDSDESGGSLRLERSVHCGMMQDTMAMKTMLFRLKRVLQENMDEDILLRSETHNPFDTKPSLAATLQQHLTNGLTCNGAATGTQMNGLFGTCLNNTGSHQTVTPSMSSVITSTDAEANHVELVDLRRQVLYLQGQLEDKEKEVERLQGDVERMKECGGGEGLQNGGDVGGGCSCNAATQTDRIRPISCGPAILDTATAGNGSLVSSTEVTSSTANVTTTMRGSRLHHHNLAITPRKNILPPSVTNNNNNCVNNNNNCVNNNSIIDSQPQQRSSSRPPLRQRMSAPSPHRIMTFTPVNVGTSVGSVAVASSIPRRSCSRTRT